MRIAVKPSEVSRIEIQEGLERVGMRSGDVVLVHSSLSRFGYVHGGADAVIDALLDTLGSHGTLMMSAISTSTKFVVRCIEAAERGDLAEVAPFDPNRAPSWAGTVAETFRRRRGVLRSLHPTHSVTACGALANEMLFNHENAPGPCGEGTPYMRLTEQQRGFILLLGVNHQSNTALHGFEELAGCDYALYPALCRIPIRTAKGEEEARTRVHIPFIARRLGVLETQFIDGAAQTVSHIGDSYIRYINAGRMRDITLHALGQDPHLFLTEEARREWTRNPVAEVGAKISWEAGEG